MQHDETKTPTMESEMESGASLFAHVESDSHGNTGSEVVSAERPTVLTQTRRSSQAELRPATSETALSGTSKSVTTKTNGQPTGNGHASGGNKRPVVESGVESRTRICQCCGKPFTPRRAKASKVNPLKFCSRQCHSSFYKGKPLSVNESFITPPSTKAERIRANGLVNKRLKLGWFKRPERCQKCDKRARLDGHHEDYMLPGHVAYVCRSCHMKAHQDPAYLADVVPINTNHRDDGMPKGHGSAHGRGGRKGPTGKAVGRAPLRRVIRVEQFSDGSASEVLTCGHRFSRTSDLPTPKQRRCTVCRDAAIAERGAA